MTSHAGAASTAAMPAVEWVYLRDTDEPTVFEVTTSPSQVAGGTGTTHSLHSLFTSTLPVEESTYDADSPLASHEVADDAVTPLRDEEFVGDASIIDDRIPPDVAFEAFLGKNFPRYSEHDFSGSLYAPQPPRKHVPPAPRPVASLPGAESQAQRLRRLSAEVNALADDVGITGEDGDIATDSPRAQLADLRAQLRAIEYTVAVPPIGRHRAMRDYHTAALAPDPRDDQNNNKDNNDSAGGGEEGSGAVAVQLVSPAVSAVATLERRVSQLENAVGAPALEAAFDGASLASTLVDVRARLALASDPTLAGRLKDDARQIANLLRTDLASETGKHALRVATVLDKLDMWQGTLDAVPVLVDRLASVRRLQEEAASFNDALAALGLQLDRLESRQGDNVGLLQTVRSSIDVNVKTVDENIDILNKRVDALKKPDANN